MHEDTLHSRMRATRRGPTMRTRSSPPGNLASAYDSAGRDTESLVLREDVLRRSEALHGPDHRDALVDRMNLGEAYRKAGRSAEALAMHEETLRRLIATHGPDHPHTLIGQGNLARAYKVAGRLDRAIPLSRGGRGVHDSRSSAPTIAIPYPPRTTWRPPMRPPARGGTGDRPPRADALRPQGGSRPRPPRQPGEPWPSHPPLRRTRRGSPVRAAPTRGPRLGPNRARCGRPRPASVALAALGRQTC